MEKVFKSCLLESCHEVRQKQFESIEQPVCVHVMLRNNYSRGHYAMQCLVVTGSQLLFACVLTLLRVATKKHFT